MIIKASVVLLKFKLKSILKSTKCYKKTVWSKEVTHEVF